MSVFTAKDVKELRERTGAGMMDCKKALDACAGKVEDAVDWLRKKGLAAAAKKAGRAAAEGLVGVKAKGTAGAVVEVNAETDFVARNEQFQTFVSTLATLAADHKGDLTSLKSALYPGSEKTVAQELTNLIAVIGENIELRRLQLLSVSKGAVAHYVHNALKPNLGRVGVLVGLESETADPEALMTLGKQIAMHIAAAHPQALRVDDLDPEVVARERAVFEEQAQKSGRPAEFLGKMVEGRLRKFYEDAVLLEQVFLIDDTKRKVSQVVADKAKELGADIKLVGYVHFKLGDGLTKQEADFAAEVAELSQ